MTQTTYTKEFLSMTATQIKRVLAVLDSGKTRNWYWFQKWMEDPAWGKSHPADTVTDMFESDTGWEGTYPWE